jgi:hypothetical protein
MAKNKLVSGTEGYGLKMEKIPNRIVRTTNGCVRSRIERPPTYEDKCSQKTARKKARKESNISMKKYHHSPAFGVRSVRVSCIPYVRDRNSHELPVSTYDMLRSTEEHARNTRTHAPANLETGSMRRLIDCLSYASRTSGGSSNTGYMERYEAKDKATTALKGDPAMTLDIAWRIAQLVKTLVGRPIHVAMVKGLKRYLEPQVSFAATSRGIESRTLPPQAVQKPFCPF